jgi:integrase
VIYLFIHKSKKDFHLKNQFENIKTLNDLFIEYISLVKPLQSTQTIKTKISYYKKHIQSNIGKSIITQLNFIDYQQKINELLNSGLKPKTVKHIKDLLQVINKLACKMGLIEKNPLHNVELPKFDNRVYFTLPRELQEQYIRSIIHFDEDDYKDIFLFLLHGRRLSEVLNLKWDMVDLDNESYVIPAPINKARKSMQYFFTPLLSSRLRRKYNLDKLFYEKDFLTGYVFINPNTNEKYKDIRKSWRRLQVKNNLPKIRIHDIRHLIGTYTINYLNIPIEYVSNLLGHTDILTTQKYVYVNPKNSRDVVQKVFDSVSLS